MGGVYTPRMTQADYGSLNLDAATLPLLHALQSISDAARTRKASGIDDTAVAYGRLACLALQWRNADVGGDIETAEKLLNKIQTTQL